MPMAHFMAVIENVIRVQLPGGARYAPALHAAASKTGARSGLSSRHLTALDEIVRAAVAVLNGAGSSTITLELTIHEQSIAARLIGKSAKPPTAKLLTVLESVAAEHSTEVSSRTGKSSFIIRFEV